MRISSIGVRTHTYTALHTTQPAGPRWLLTPPSCRLAAHRPRSQVALGPVRDALSTRPGHCGPDRQDERLQSV